MARRTCADATRHARPHGRAVRGPPKAQVAGGRRPRQPCMAHVAGSHADAREGRHVAGGLAGEGLMG